MLKVIEIDNQGKDVDGYVFTLTIGTERFGITDQEVAEMIKAKYASSKSGTKRSPQRKTSATEQTSGDNTPLIPETETPRAAGLSDGVESPH